MTPIEELAQILEDKGSFLRGPPSAPNQPRIVFTSVDYDEVAKVAKLLGVKYIRRSAKNSKQQRPYIRFDVQLKAARGIAIMRLLRPLLSTPRQEEIDYALAGTVRITRNTLRRHQLRVEQGLEARVGGRAYRESPAFMGMRRAATP